MNILSQVHGGRARQFQHYADLFEKFAAQDKPFLLVKTMATPRRDCMVPYQAEFFDTIEELEAARTKYRTQDIRENGLDVLFTTGFEWDLGINFIPDPSL